MSKPGGKGRRGMTSLGGEGADTRVSCLDKVGLGESDPFHLISMRMLPGGRQPARGREGPREGGELRNAGLGALSLEETDLPSINGPGRLLRRATGDRVTGRAWWG